MALSKSQLKSIAARKAKANLHWQAARDISDAGGTFEEAVARTWMKPHGLRNLIGVRTGTRTWPIITLDRSPS